jgi:hypothetical protein
MLGQTAVKRRRGREMTTTGTLPVELTKCAKTAAIQRQISFRRSSRMGFASF